MDRKYWVGLSLIPGIGSVKIKRLIDCFHSPKRIWEASEEELIRVPSLGPKTVKAIVHTKKTTDLDQFMQMCRQNQIKIITLGDDAYPLNLREIYDPPPVLYYRGELLSSDSQSVAIVGSRKMTSYGGRVTRKLASELTEAGFTVISGMALGVDGIAHQGALDAGGRTIAVLGSGIDYIYPKEHTKLYNQIIQSGAVISAYPPATIPDKGHFPARNRIISGLSLGTVVVEAKSRSGALITAEQALEQNREVFAVPGSIFSAMSQGTNELIQKGAHLVSSVQDILNELTPYLTNTPEEALPNALLVNIQLNMIESQIVSLLESGEKTGDELIEEMNLGIADLNTHLFGLEIKGVIQQTPGQKYALMR